MKRLLIAITVLVAGTAVLAGQPEGSPLEVAGLEPTPLFPRGEPLMQVARLTVANRTSL